MGTAEGFFDDWADLYDADYREQEIGDTDFYVDLATEANGPVLEVGCGTGRIYLELLRAGVDADGIDISTAMLEVLREKARADDLEPSVWRADMRSIEADRTYALIMIPFRAFLHNITVRDQLQALRQLRTVLEPGGRLAMNMFVPSFDVICDSYGRKQRRTIEQDGESLEIIDHTRIVDEVEQVVEGHRQVLKDGDVIRDSRFRLALISKPHFEALVEATGWSDVTGYGGFAGEPLEHGATEMVWVLTR